MVSLSEGMTLTIHIFQMKLFNAVSAVALSCCLADPLLLSKVHANDIPELDGGPELRTCYFSSKPVPNKEGQLLPIDCMVERYTENGNKYWYVKTAEGSGIKFQLFYDDDSKIYTAKTWVIHEKTGEEVVTHMEWGFDSEGDFMLYSDRHKVNGISFEMYINTAEDNPDLQRPPIDTEDDDEYIDSSQAS